MSIVFSSFSYLSLYRRNCENNPLDVILLMLKYGNFLEGVPCLGDILVALKSSLTWNIL